jgi:hypothetical protein
MLIETNILIDKDYIIYKCIYQLYFMCQLHQYMNSKYYYNIMEFYITISSKQKLCLVFRYFKYHMSRNLVSGGMLTLYKKTCT